MWFWIGQFWVFLSYRTIAQYTHIWRQPWHLKITYYREWFYNCIKFLPIIFLLKVTNWDQSCTTANSKLVLYRRSEFCIIQYISVISGKEHFGFWWERSLLKGTIYGDFQIKACITTNIYTSLTCTEGIKTYCTCTFPQLNIPPFYLYTA